MKNNYGVLLFLFYLIFSAAVYGQEISIKVIEVKGIVDIKTPEAGWQKALDGTILSPGFEVTTGFRSQLTLEIGNSSYITINQNTTFSLDVVRARQREAIIETRFVRGYIVAYAKKVDNFSNKIFVSFDEGSVIFENSGGEIYSKRPDGVFVNNFLGKSTVKGKMLDTAFLGNDEKCMVNSDGKIIDGNYLTKRLAKAKPSFIDNVLLENSYYGNETPIFSQEYDWNDYTNQFRP